MNNYVYLVSVSTDDYESLYIDGMLAFAEHRLDLNQVLKALVGYEIMNYTSYYIDGDVLEENYDCVFPLYFKNFNLEDLTT